MKQHNNIFPTSFLSMILSEGSCDTEDWSNDAENTALRYIYIENSSLKML